MGVRLWPGDWSPVRPGEGGVGLGQNPLLHRFAESASCREPENGSWRPRLVGQRLMVSDPTPIQH